MTDIPPEELEAIRARHEALEQLGHLAHHDWASEAHADRATLLQAITEAQERAETNSALADRLESHTEQMANTSWGLTMQEWNVISNDILLAARTLRAAQTLKERKDE